MRAFSGNPKSFAGNFARFLAVSSAISTSSSVTAAVPDSRRDRNSSQLLRNEVLSSPMSVKNLVAESYWTTCTSSSIVPSSSPEVL